MFVRSFSDRPLAAERVLCATVILAALLASPLSAAGKKLDFNRDIRPILAEHCFACHGPDEKKREADLRLDTRAGLFSEINDIIPVVPGRPDQSEIILRITSADRDEVMPPPKAKKELKSEQIAVLREWVAQGAEFQQHWAFIAPQKPPVPPIAGATTPNPIDAFIQAALAPHNLSPAAEADRETLIRRVSFALTGLPPSIKEIEEYVADDRPDAFEKVVDRYLASPHYGEQMARHWLDLARYGDTHGMHLDNERSMWPYRDWVVRAFNRNLPFDQFTIEQLAGDLLPNPTEDQLIATGFNRCNVTTGEGGSIDAEWLFRYAVDRTATTAEAWMGLTAGCAVCHDHKFDPISQKEFYALYAFFYSAADPALDGNTLLTAPTVQIVSAEQRAKLDELGAKIAAAEKTLREQIEAVAYVDPAELQPRPPAETVENISDKTGVTGREDPVADPRRSLAAWLAANQGKPAKELPADIRDLLKKPAKDRTPDQEKKLREHYLVAVCRETQPKLAAVNTELAARKKERDDLNASLPASFIMKDLPQPRQAHVMIRGQYDRPGEAVGRAVPAIFPALAPAAASVPNRLDLAKWLIREDHPLTARVAVNRLWQQFFGTGLVKSAGDFGAQSEAPSHPELLDWLAVTFRESGWDVKSLVRLFVTSATFRQATEGTLESWQRDPANRLLARGPRLRLDAEEIRDNALFTSGLINLQIGGKGVKPYQPPNIWEPVGFVGSNTAAYKQDHGAALYRRSLYTFLKRTAPPPFMANFDGPSREQACTRRERSNTPLQALQLMNDVQHFEAARALAERMMLEGGASAEERVAFAYRAVLARRPGPEELAVVQDAFARHLAKFNAQPDAAEKAVKNGESPPKPGLPAPELAAWTMIANLLLNLDETITRN